MRRLFLLALAAALGIGLGEYLTTSFSFRRALGHLVRRGDLQVLVDRNGIYNTDVERIRHAGFFANGAEPQDIDAAAAERQRQVALERLIEEEHLHARSANQTVAAPAVAREVNLLRAQFGDEKSWTDTLAKAALSRRALEREVTLNLRDQAWLDGQIASRFQPNEAVALSHFNKEKTFFGEPLRFRASHLFLAAPEGSPAGLVEAKRLLIEQLSQRLTNGESFPILVTEFSEDEASKKRDGNLNYFAATRMLPEVFVAAKALKPGETSLPVRTRLGFHILRLTDIRPARTLQFEEAQPEIVAGLENGLRLRAVQQALNRP